MEKQILFASVITVLFFVLKYAESRYLEKDERPFKYLVRDATIVFLSSVGVLFTASYFDTHVQDFLVFLTGTGKTTTPEKAQIFTGEPEF